MSKLFISQRFLYDLEEGGHLILGIYFLVGLIFGSFVNVVIHRLPYGRSLWGPRSLCPMCGVQISAMDNIPLLSYLWLRARCRSCNGLISVRYPLVELWVAVTWATLFFIGFSGFELILNAGIFTCLIAHFFIDLDQRLLLNKINALIVFFAIALVAQSFEDLWPNFIAALLVYLLLFGLSELFFHFRGKQGLGMGDVKLFAALALWRGPVSLVSIVLLSSILGLGFGVVQRLRTRDWDGSMPFGPFIVVATYFEFFLGSIIWPLYLIRI